MPGIESFGRVESSGPYRYRGTVSFAEPGGPIQLYSESPSGVQQSITARIVNTHGPRTPVETVPNLGPPLPKLETLKTPQNLPLPNAQIVEAAAKTTAVAAGGVGVAEAAGGVVLATNPEILIPIGLGLLAVGAAAAIYNHFKEAPEKVELGLNLAVPFAEAQEEAAYLATVEFTYPDGQVEDHEVSFWGPIKGFRPTGTKGGANIEVLCRGNRINEPPQAEGWYLGYRTGTSGQDTRNNLKNLRRVDGQPTVFPPPSPYPMPTTELQPARAPDTGLSPGASHLPYAEPPEKSLPLGLDLAPSQSQKPAQTVELPPGVPITISSPGATPVTVTTNATKPSTLMLPGKISSGEPTPISISSPGSKPIAFSTPGTGTVTISIPGYEPIAVDPTGQTKTAGLTRSSDPTKTSTFRPTPTNKTAPDTKTPTIDPVVLTGLATITTILQGLQKNVTPEAIETAAAAGTCRTLQPGNCLSPTADNAKEAADNAKANGTKLDRLNTALQGLDLGLLKVMDNKLGPQLVGGLSGKLGRLSQWLRIDRALNLLTYAAVLHNAMMLSNDFAQTLIAATNAFIKAFVLKDDEAATFDLSTVLGKSIENTAKSIFGGKTVAYWEVQWKKCNRIYQAAANVINRFTNIASAIFTVLEVLGSRISKIGNALRWYGDIGDKAYDTMNESDNFQHPIFIKMQKLQTAASAIETVSSSVTTVKEEYKSLQTDTKELKTAIDKAATKNQKDDDAEIRKILAQKTDESLIE